LHVTWARRARKTYRYWMREAWADGGAQILNLEKVGGTQVSRPRVLVLTSPGLSSGHIPHSISVPITDLLDPNDKTLLPASELKVIFKSKGVDPSKPIINSCGTGVTAAVIDAALTEAGFPTQQRRLYDGSWTEWAQRVKSGDGMIRKTE
jgi:3-mercaptopyruvate sulfurtransferase SseA